MASHGCDTYHQHKDGMNEAMASAHWHALVESKASKRRMNATICRYRVLTVFLPWMECVCVCVTSTEGRYLLTTSMECSDISMLTSTLKYSVICCEWISFSRTEMATIGLFSTSSGSCGEKGLDTLVEGAVE